MCRHNYNLFLFLKKNLTTLHLDLNNSIVKSIYGYSPATSENVCTTLEFDEHLNRHVCSHIPTDVGASCTKGSISTSGVGSASACHQKQLRASAEMVSSRSKGALCYMLVCGVVRLWSISVFRPDTQPFV